MALYKWTPCQTLESIIYVSSKLCHEDFVFFCFFFCFYVVVFWLKSQLASSPFHPNWGSQHHLNMFNVIKCQKWGKNPFQTHEIFRDFMNNYTTSCEYAFFGGGTFPLLKTWSCTSCPPKANHILLGSISLYLNYMSLFNTSTIGQTTKLIGLFDKNLIFLL